MYLHLCIFLTLLKIQSEATVTVGSTEFKTVATSSAFVDKTMLIQHVLESKHNILVTTPPRFGKSTNIDMIKTFLEIEVDEFGDPVTEANITSSHINDTENLLWFLKNKLKITKHFDIMLQLGRTPVISVDFKRKLPPTGVRCLHDVIKVCKEVIHNSYMAHEYLLYSEALSLENKQLIRTWCDEHSYKTKIDNMFMSHGLLSLSQLLHKHFSGRKVFILVDNHDFLITRASYDVENDVELKAVVRFVYGILSDVVNENNEVVRGAFITGVSPVPTISDFNLTNFQIYKFLGNHNYSEYFGFTRKEVDEIIKKSEYYLDYKEIKLVHKSCNGYHSKCGVELYNLYSVLMFLKLKRTGIFCTIDDYPPQVLEIIKKPEVKMLLDRLLQEEIIQVKPFHQLSTNDVDIQNCLRETSKKSDDSNFLLYLLNWGLLTYTDKGIQTSEEFDFIQIPNNEIKDVLLNL